MGAPYLGALLLETTTSLHFQGLRLPGNALEYLFVLLPRGILFFESCTTTNSGFKGLLDQGFNGLN